MAEQDYYGLTGMAEVLAGHGAGREAWVRAAQYLDRAGTLRDSSVDGELLGREYYLRGFLASRLGDLDEAERWFGRSLDVYAHPDNASRRALSGLAELKMRR